LNDLPIEWHYIGRIQGNKTRDIARHFTWVHGLDSLKHAQQLNKYRGEDRPPLNCCIQVNLSGEHSKGGIEADLLPELALAVSRLPHLELRGLMTMPDPTSDRDAQAAVFSRLAASFDRLRAQGLPLDTLSMGMSGDLELAIAAGSTMVRIGTDIFGPRN
ncbi:MAG: YggS family pyridoxal phosphate-dependent enzyme, partial [Gammaproteobacteria bacterium]